MHEQVFDMLQNFDVTWCCLFRYLSHFLSRCFIWNRTVFLPLVFEQYILLLWQYQIVGLNLIWLALLMPFELLWTCIYCTPLTWPLLPHCPLVYMAVTLVSSLDGCCTVEKESVISQLLKYLFIHIYFLFLSALRSKFKTVL